MWREKRAADRQAAAFDAARGVNASRLLRRIFACRVRRPGVKSIRYVKECEIQRISEMLAQCGLAGGHALSDSIVFNRGPGEQ